MDQEIGSVMAYSYLKIQPLKIYSKSVPEDFVVPSIYFPKPVITESHETLNAFSKTYTVYMKVFYPTKEEAVDKANELMHSILVNRYKIPLINEDGSFANTYLRVMKIEVKELEGAAQIAITWESRYEYGIPTYTKMRKFFLTEVID